MIKRLVRMHLLPGRADAFLDIFDQAKQNIRAMEGCLGLEVLTEGHGDEISVWTISLWVNEDALEHYRKSALFASTWSAVKPLFASKAQAWTLRPIECVE